ncbi:unnamed protein product [Rotaria sp. Silwood2]|nr:unnamed protein product [Rotaria sp. Silwood2]CAF2519236.1 unnamed protein product [Rotaria sp. Silwood2]CAF2757298.1 unnamed protein product [Rotaria sp. Silwood2]CAF2970634.1 unnamed protein product [Rotaria sp. Silwood2]CAF3860196.1 unnamed protein product [Rotaria sp. Silwood2]
MNSHYDINFLLCLALQKVAFLPFDDIMDKYRFLLFRDRIDRKHELNSQWRALRIKSGEIMAAVPRRDKINFDVDAKYHKSSNVPYLRYFIAHIHQFQFRHAMCQL